MTPLKSAETGGHRWDDLARLLFRRTRNYALIARHRAITNIGGARSRATAAAAEVLSELFGSDVEYDWFSFTRADRSSVGSFASRRCPTVCTGVLF